MAGVRIGKHSATFPRGYSTQGPLFVMVFGLATRFRGIRSFVFELPHSRFRMLWVARYYHFLMEQLRDGDFRFVRAIDPSAQLTLFVETYVGAEGWREALTEWRATLVSFHIELVEFVNPSGPHVLLCLYLGGEGRVSGLAVEDLVYFSLTVKKGQTVRGQFFEDKAEALAAVGLST